MPEQNQKKMINLISPEDSYREYRLTILEEAEEILANKELFIASSGSKIKEKIDKLQEISDFFYLEEEYELSNQFLAISKAIQIKRILRI